MRPRAVAVFALVCLSPFNAVSDDLPSSDKTDWTIAVAGFQTDFGDSALVSASTVLAQMIRDELSELRFHILSDDERRLIVREVLDERQRRSLNSIRGYHEKRDALIFDLNADPERRADYDELLDQERMKLSSEKEFTEDDVLVPEILPVIFPESESNSLLWELDQWDPEVYRITKSLDLLITGETVEVGSYFGVAAYAWTSVGKTVLWEGAGGESELSEIARQISAAARSTILGRPWASLTVSVDPPDSVISIDGRPVGVGYWSDTALEPGKVVVEMSAQGYEPRVVETVLSEGEHRELSLSLDAAERGQVLVRSVPPGASVRLGSLWLGRTPIGIDVPDRVMPITLEKDGYRSRTVPFFPETERLTVPLVSAIADPVEDLAQHRRKLYNSVTWFSLSLAPTMMSLGLSYNYAGMLATASTAAEQQFAYDAYMISSGLTWGSVAVNAGLLAVVLVRLSRYLKAAEELSD